MDTAASKPIFESPSFGFRYMSNDPTIKDFNKLMDFSTTLTDTGKYLVFASASRKDAYLKEDIAKYGLVHNPDESMKMMDGWIGSTVGSHAIDCVKQPKFTGFTMASHERLTDLVLGKYVTDVHYHGPINDFGPNLSRAENLRQARDRYEQSREAIKDGENISYIGIIPNNKTIYSVGRLKNEEIRLSIGTKADEHLSREASMFGLTLEDITMLKQTEEAMHIKRESYDKMFLTIGQLIREERATKNGVLKLYKRLAENEIDPKQKEKYERAVKAIEHDIETIGRYRHIKDNEDTSEEAVENNEEKSDLEKEVENSDLEAENWSIESEELPDYKTNSEISEYAEDGQETEQEAEPETSDESAE